VKYRWSSLFQVCSRPEASTGARAAIVHGEAGSVREMRVRWAGVFRPSDQTVLLSTLSRAV
jgi:hypothetical protein